MYHGQWTMYHGQCIMDNVPWTMHNGLCTMDNVPWKIDNVPWTMDNVPWTMPIGHMVSSYLTDHVFCFRGRRVRVLLTLATNRPLGDVVRPDVRRYAGRCLAKSRKIGHKTKVQEKSVTCLFQPAIRIDKYIITFKDIKFF